MILIDAHEDLAWNILTFGRDYTRSAQETRAVEQNGIAPKHNGDTLLGWENYQRGETAIIFATLFAAPRRAQQGSWDTQVYNTAEEAHTLYQAQLDTYHRLVDQHPDKFRLILSKEDLDETIKRWQNRRDDIQPPVGLTILMENAEGVRHPSEVELWWQRGVRIIGPAWGGTRFCGGTREPGPLTSEGHALLEAMAATGFILDLSHMDEAAALEVLDTYPGTIIASHANAARLIHGVQSNRFLSDRLIQGIIERDGVIGIIPFNVFLLGGWRESDGRDKVTLDHVVAQIDYICQLAGNANHVGIGSDFDGGFGVQKTPTGIDTIADLQKIIPLLEAKGYSDKDIHAIFHQNWLRRLEPNLPRS